MLTIHVCIWLGCRNTFRPNLGRMTILPPHSYNILINQFPSLVDKRLQYFSQGVITPVLNFILSYPSQNGVSLVSDLNAATFIGELTRFIMCNHHEEEWVSILQAVPITVCSQWAMQSNSSTNTGAAFSR